MSQTPFRTRLLSIAACGVLAGGVSACEHDNIDPGADLLAGKKAFAQKCGSCHVLERAGTQGATGPSLDAAFDRALRDGMGRGTIQGVVHDQILYPANVPQESEAYMPPKLVTGKLARDVAAYVAFAAARPGEDKGKLAAAGGTPPVPADAPPGLKLFVAGKDDAQACGNCHTLGAARTQATTGPDLDAVLKGKSAKEIEKAIVDPSAELTPGFSDIMPKDYGEALTDAELQELADYLAEQTG
ncbi:MAG: c-type cytochrome [Actinobacteria bacterium]|nr:c-type cytochrome [Actinomycetota bacterium]